MNGVLVVNKPAGVTSRKIVDRIEEWFPGVRAGHAGTLDPLATGVLVLCLGSATRLIEYVQRMAKTYAVRVRLGAHSDSDDADGTIEPVQDALVPSPQQLADCLQEFVGEIDQAPPAYSAAHIEGRRAYDLARKGRQVSPTPRRVRIHRIELQRYLYPEVDLTVDCGKGTYIRSLARDLGKRLGCGGYVERLQRTRVGPFHVSHALSLEAGPDVAQSQLLPPRAAVSELPQTTLNDDDLRRLRQGQRVRLDLPLPDGEVAVLDRVDTLAGVALCDVAQRMLRAAKML